MDETAHAQAYLSIGGGKSRPSTHLVDTIPSASMDRQAGQWGPHHD